MVQKITINPAEHVTLEPPCSEITIQTFADMFSKGRLQMLAPHTALKAAVSLIGWITLKANFLKDSFEHGLLTCDVLTSNMKKLCVLEDQWFLIMSKLWSTQPHMTDFPTPPCLCLPSAWALPSNSHITWKGWPLSSCIFESPNYWRIQSTTLDRFTVWFNMTNCIFCNSAKL